MTRGERTRLPIILVITTRGASRTHKTTQAPHRWRWGRSVGQEQKTAAAYGVCGDSGEETKFDNNTNCIQIAINSSRI